MCVCRTKLQPFIDCIIGSRRSWSSSLFPDVETPTIRASFCRSTALSPSMSMPRSSFATSRSSVLGTGIHMCLWNPDTAASERHFVNMDLSGRVKTKTSCSNVTVPGKIKLNMNAKHECSHTKPSSNWRCCDLGLQRSVQTVVSISALKTEVNHDIPVYVWSLVGVYIHKS